MKFTKLLRATTLVLLVTPNSFGAWDFKKNISDAIFNSCTSIIQDPAAECDGFGHLHAVWVDGNCVTDIYYAKSTDNGQSWSNPTPIGTGYHPQIAIDGSDNIHVVYEEVGSHYIYYKRSTNGGASFSSAAYIGQSSGTDFWPDIAADDSPSPFVHIVWSSGAPDYHLLYRRSVDGGASWQTTVTLPGTATGAKPSIATDGTSWVHVAFTSGSQLQYVKSDDRGATWAGTAEVLCTSCVHNWFSTAIDALPAAGVHIAFMPPANTNPPQVISSTDHGASWGNIKQIPYAAGGSTFDPSIAVSGNGVVRVAFESHAGHDSIWVATSTDFGVTWDTPVSLSRVFTDAFYYFPDITTREEAGVHYFYVLWGSDKSGYQNPDYDPDVFFMRDEYIPEDNSPTAYIDDISPNPAEEGETVCFTGHGTDPNGTIVAYNWISDIDGQLSTQASFCTSSLSVGEHTIYFKVQDNDLNWSPEVFELLEVTTQPQPHWTIIVYLNGDNNLEGAAIDDINEMEVVGSSGDVNIIVQVDRIPGYDNTNGDWTDTRRYYINSDTDPNIINSTRLDVSPQLGELNMGDPQTLVDFVNWGIDNYSANQYAVVIWDHGSGWYKKIFGIDNYEDEVLFKGVSWDDTDGDNIGVSDGDWESAISAIKNHLGRNIDICGFDACLMQMWEVMDITDGYADYQVGSQEVENFDGWNYTQFLTALIAEPAMSPEELGNEIVDAAVDGDNEDTQSSVDLTQVSTLTTVVDDFADELLAAIIGDAVNETTIDNIRVQLTTLGHEFDITSHVDLYDFCNRVNSEATLPSSLRTAASNVMTAIDNTITWNRVQPAYSWANGIAIYYPADPSEYDDRYDNLPIAPSTLWDDFITWLCGDVDCDHTGPNIGDLTYLVDYLFFDGPAPPVMEAANVDGEGGINVADLMYMVDYLFFSGPEPICGPIE